MPSSPPHSDIGIKIIDISEKEIDEGKQSCWLYETNNRMETRMILFVSSSGKSKGKEGKNLLALRKLVVKDYTLHNEYRSFN